MAELTRLEYKLNDEAIVKITDFMETWLTDHKIQSKNRTVFMLESMLLDIEAHSTQELDVTLRIVRKLGKRSIKITYGGDAYNPSQNEEGGPLTRFFLEEMGFTPTWSYENKTNELVLEIPANRLKEETILLISFLAAMLILELKELKYVSSAGLRELLELQQIMNNQGEMVIKNPSQAIMDVLEVSGFSMFMNIESDQA
ncbi:MAG: STAS domain-containing protein [Lachnospiraceae bacterium]|nr:STAS domain-containing protein [Lachnospiraceae bacterium]